MNDQITTPTTDEDDFAVCVECGAEDVFFLPHTDECTRTGDIIVKAAPE